MENSQNNKNIVSNNDVALVETNEQEAVDNVDDNEHLASPIKNFITYTTAHGLSRFSAAQGYLKILWVLLLCGTYIGFSYHLSTLVSKYLTKPLLTTYDPEYPYQFPDVYICPKEQLSLSRVFANIKQDQFKTILASLFDSKLQQLSELGMVSSKETSYFKKMRQTLDFNVWSSVNKLSTDYQDITTILNKVEKKLLNYYLTPLEPQFNSKPCYVNFTSNYDGNVSFAGFNKKCDKWENYNITVPKGSENYCRSPDYDRYRPWCYVNGVKEYCNIIYCQPKNRIYECIRNEVFTSRKETFISEHEFTNFEGDRCIFKNVSGLIDQAYCKVTSFMGDNAATCVMYNKRNLKTNYDLCAIPICTDLQIENVGWIISEYLKNILLKTFGPDLYLNLQNCKFGKETCNARDFLTFAHPSLGVCYKFKSEKFLTNKKFNEISKMKLDLELYSDSHDLRGQEYYTSTSGTLAMGLKPKLNKISQSGGFNMFVMPQGEFPHDVARISDNLVVLENGYHTTLGLRFDIGETFPDGICIKRSDVKNVTYNLQNWKNLLNNRMSVTSVLKNQQRLNVSNETLKSASWQDLLNLIYKHYNDNMYSSPTATNFTFWDTKQDCINNEILKFFAEDCKCIPSFLPIALESNLTKIYPACSDENSGILPKTASCYHRQLGQIENVIEHALNKCPERCNVPKYNIVKYSVLWPGYNFYGVSKLLKDVSEKYDFYNKKNKWKGIAGLYYAYIMTKIIQEKRNKDIADDPLLFNNLTQIQQGIHSSFAKVSIQGRSPYGDRFYREEAYPINNLIADLGGCLGLWSGISVLTICELAEVIYFMVLIIYNRIKHKRSLNAHKNANSKTNYSPVSTNV